MSMYNLQEYKGPIDHLADILPWAVMIAPGIILNKDGSFQQTLQFPGASTRAELVNLCTGLNGVLGQFKGGWAFFIEAMRQLDQMFASQLDNNSTANESHYRNNYYLTLVYMPPEERKQKAKAKTKATEHSEDCSRYLACFSEQVNRVKAVAPHIDPLTEEETLTYLHHTISTKRHKVAMPESLNYLDTLLSDMSLKGGLEPMLGDSYLKTITVKSLPIYAMPDVLLALACLPLEYRWVTRYIALDKQYAVKQTSAYRRTWFAKRKGVAMTMGKPETMGYGYVTATVTVWDKDYAKVSDKAEKVEQVINGLGFITHNENAQILQAWLGSVPGQCVANIRKPLLGGV